LAARHDEGGQIPPSQWGRFTLTQPDNSGNYVHSAPWSVADQGNRNVSHGCINVSPSNAEWFYDNFDAGDPIVVTNSVDSETQNDGAQDWQL
jgi:lipoprotein-anchoring transpeptidase ErfK/SrfK